MAALSYSLKSDKDRVLVDIVIALEKERIRCFTIRVILAPDECGGPVSVLIKGFVIDGRRGCPSQDPHLRLRSLEPLDIPVRHLKSQIPGRVNRHSRAKRIEPRPVDVPP